MEIAAGYKKTEIGVIPEDWDLKELGQVIRSVEYGSALKSKPSGKVPVLRMGNIQNGRFDLTDLVYTDDFNEINKYLLKYNDVLFNRTNTADLVGKTAIYKEEIPAIFAGYLIRINIKPERLNADYLNYWLNTRIAKDYGQLVLSIAVGQANINGSKLKTYPITLPRTLAEQTDIATALSDTDALIISLGKLISKKRNIKHGAMQKLLQPKEGWETKKLGEVCEIRKGQLITDSTRINGTIPVIAGGKTPAYYHNKPNRIGKTITISGSGASAGYVALHCYPIFASDCSTIEENESYSIDFIFYLMQLLQDKIFKMQTGGAQPHIHPNDLKPIQIPFPPIAEQIRIATILSDMDSEIAALETKLEKYGKIKLGMMQNLLTGKIRLI